MEQTVDVKILSYKSPQRYAVWRTLMAAQSELRKTIPGFAMRITEIKELGEMEKYTAVVILPSLLVDDQLVCIGRFPKKEEAAGWLREATARRKAGQVSGSP